MARALEALASEIVPGGRLVGAEPLAPDGGGGGDTGKGAGYGAPIRLRVVDPGGVEHALVFRTMRPNDFGHDRRADRAAGLLLAFDTFGVVPDHVRALDVGAIAADGRLLSLRDGGEFYLVTSWARGRLYAEDLRRVARDGACTPEDEERAARLAAWLVDLHARKGAALGDAACRSAAVYTRAIRDLLGHGEGIFGVVDAYGPTVPGAPPDRLRAIERRCLEWRFRLRGRADRLARIHGDFHPFNVVVDGDAFTLLDASRGCAGEPADDVTAMAVNFPFFALSRAGSWARGLGPLWRRFFATYLDGSGDGGLYDVLAPFLAWRCLVVACPAFYPSLREEARDRLLALAERALDAPRFDPAMGEELFS